MTMQQLQVRAAVGADKERITEICYAINPDDWVPEHLDGLIGNGLYVAEQAGRIIGLYQVDRFANADVYFSGMRIDPAVQGKGIGTLFCRLQVEQARAEGAHHIYLISAADNQRAHRTVERNGFERLGEYLVCWIDDFVWPELGSPLPVRAATAADIPAIRRLIPATPMAHVVAATMPYDLRTAEAADWDPANFALVEGEAGLLGVINWLINPTDNQMLIRRLHGTPEAAEALWAHVRAKAVDVASLGFGVVGESEPLLAPLRLNPAHLHRFIAFGLPAEKELPEAGIPVQVPEFS